MSIGVPATPLSSQLSATVPRKGTEDYAKVLGLLMLIQEIKMELWLLASVWPRAFLLCGYLGSEKQMEGLCFSLL